MNIKEIKEMIELMKENGITEFELERDGMKISLKRGPRGSVKEVVVEQVAVPAPGSTQVSVPEPAAPIITRSENVHFIKSPMVGTFYRAPSPEAEPFVAKGQMVSSEDTVCIIEAMKVMNEIKAEVKGKILEVLVENGEPVEFGQPLFKVEKA